jgi:hypothetical protein
MDHGLRAWEAADMDRDPDLASLRGDPRFEAIVADVKKRAKD